MLLCFLCANFKLPINFTLDENFYKKIPQIGWLLLLLFGMLCHVGLHVINAVIIATSFNYFVSCAHDAALDVSRFHSCLLLTYFAPKVYWKVVACCLNVLEFCSCNFLTMELLIFFWAVFRTNTNRHYFISLNF